MMALIAFDLQSSGFYNWFLLPLFIYAGGMVYVSLATLRNVFIARNFRSIVPVIGFFEVLVWLTAVSSTIKHLNNIVCYFAFAAGYSSGIYIALAFEARLALGLQVVRIITNLDPESLLRALQDANFGTTVIDAKGSKGPVKVIFTTVKRKDVNLVSGMIMKHTPNAFYTVEDIRQVSQGVFPTAQSGNRFSFLRGLIPGGQMR